MSLVSEYGSFDQIVYPSPDDGVTILISRYRDDLGRIAKVALDIIPGVLTLTAGPVAGAVTSVAISTGKTAKSLFDYMTQPSEPAAAETKKTASQSTQSTQSTQILGQTALRIAKKMLLDTLQDNPDEPGAANIAETVSKATRQGIRKKPGSAVETVATAAIRQAVSGIIPQIVVNLFEGSKPIASCFFRHLSLFHNICALRSSIQTFSQVRTIDQRAEAALALLKPSQSDPSRLRRTSARRAEQVILKDAEQRKEIARSGGKGSKRKR